MVDESAPKTPFEARLHEALAALDKTQAEFAREIGPNGHQMLRGWKDRGRIGAPSIPRVAEILHPISVQWINDGLGERELFAPVAIVGSASPSHLLRLDRDIVHAALTLLTLDETVGGPYRPTEQAARLAHLYEWIAREGGRLSAESNARFLDQVQSRRGGSDGGDGRNDEGDR